MFILVERWIEGDRNARVRLYNQKWDAQKVRLRAIKCMVWLLIGLATGGAWMFYFTDAPTLLQSLIAGTAHPVAYTTVAILTFTTFFFGGFARQQICIYACLWPRIQAAMMDEDTLVVAYRDWRGEPRGKLKKVEEEGPPQGDCIDCMACVNVCPMRIDIRNGQQMECITCALCIDACDEVMDRIGQPRGLIDYMALKDEADERAGGKPKNIWKIIFRPRTLLYTTLWSGIGVAMVVAIIMRSPTGFNVTPVRNPLFVTLADGSIRNTYEVRLHNKHGEERPFQISISAAAPLVVSLEGQEQTVANVPADATATQRVYVTAAAGSVPATERRTALRMWVVDMTEVTDRVHTDTVFNGKEN